MGITITSKLTSTHLLKTKMKEVYGGQFEKMSGDQVIPNEEGGNMSNLFDVFYD